MPTRPKSSEADLVTDGERVLRAVRKHFAGFKKFDAKRQIKAMPPSFLDPFEATLKQARKAIGKQATGKGKKRHATVSEETCRTTLFDWLRDARDDLELAYEDDPEVAKAFGAGTAMRSDSTPELLAAAEKMSSTYEEAKYQALASDAGVDQGAILAIIKARDALKTADEEQNEALAEAVGGTMDKGALVAKTRKMTARARRVARRVFRKEPQVLAGFRSTVPRSTPVPRSTKQASSPK